MHLSDLDYLSNFGDSRFHRASTGVKLFFSVVVLASVISSVSLPFLSGILLFMVLLYISAGIPVIKIGHLALYPTFFSILFALILSQGHLAVGLIIIFRALGAALTLIFLFATTPYVDVFSSLSRWMPTLLGDIFLFSYRGLFIMLGKSHNLVQTIRLRGGYRPASLLMDLKYTAGMIGLLFIQSFAVSERMYQVFSLRGYQGFVPRTTENRAWEFEDYSVCILALLIGLGAVIL